MTQEQKELLFKDLCGRLSYGVKVEAHGLLKTIADDYDNRDIINAHVLNGLNLRDYFKTYSINCMEKVPLFNRKGVCNIKPYLFPMSSMTEEQKQYLKNRFCYDWDGEPYELWKYQIEIGDADELIDWFNKNHFDYRNLIEKGLAIDATGKNIY